MAKDFEAGVKESYSKAKRMASGSRWLFERTWLRNCLYYAGIQWIKENPATHRWIPKQLKPWVPRTVTNKFATHAATMSQVLSAKSPGFLCGPGGNTPEDIAAAEAANRFLPFILDEAGWERQRRMIVAWMVLTGNAFVHPCYDNDDSYGTTYVQHLMCTACAATFPPDESDGVTCPKCGEAGTVIESQSQGEELPIGRTRIEVFSPFEIYIDLESRSMEDVEELIVRRRYPIEHIERKYGVRVDPEASSADTGSGMTMLRFIAYAASVGEMSFASPSERRDATATLDQYWKRPCKEYPDGVVATFVHDELIDPKAIKDGIPYRDRKGKPIWPWVHYGMEHVPGRFYYKTPMDDVAGKQEQRNKIESLIQLIVTRMANPVWLLPKGIGIDTASMTGEPGQAYVYNPLPIGPGGAIKPERIPGENVPTSVVGWLEKIDRDMEELAGTFDVLKGSAPTGVTAGTALRLLLERAVTRFTPTLDDFEKNTELLTRYLLTIFQQFATEPRIASIRGEGLAWETQQFSNADIAGQIDVVVEAGSAMPQTSVGFQALLQDLNAMGLVNIQDQDIRYKIFQRFGVTDLMGPLNLDYKQALREQYRWLKEDVQPQINPMIDNHEIHYLCHKSFALTSDFEALDPMKKAQWLTHISMTMQTVAAMMMPPMMAAGGPGETAEPKGESQPVPRGGKANMGNEPVMPKEPGVPPAFPGVM